MSDETTQTQEGTVPPSWRFDDYDDESKTLSNQFGEKSQMANTGWLPDSNESREMMTSQATARKDSTDKSKMSKKSDNHSNGRKEDNGENGQSNKDSRPKASKKSKDDDADEEAEHVDLDDEDDEVRNINNPLVAELKRTDRNSGKLNRFDSVVRKLLKFDLLNKQRRRVQVRKSTQSIVCRDRNNLKLFEIRVLAGPKTLSVSITFLQLTTLTHFTIQINQINVNHYGCRS